MNIHPDLLLKNKGFWTTFEFKNVQMFKPVTDKKLRTFFLLVFVSAFLLILLVHLFFLMVPERTHKISANILTVEGFLNGTALEKVKDVFQHGGYDMLIITGLDFPAGKYYEVPMNGYLIFYPNIVFTGSETENFHIVEVVAFSELGWKDRAHFNFFVNNSLIADFYAVKKKKKYAIRWNGKLADIDSVMIQFDNDGAGRWGDRNLYVKEIIIDHKIIIPYLNNSVYEFGSLDRKHRIINNFSSNAEQTRNELIGRGVDPSRIVAVPGDETHINRTLKSALVFRDWLAASKCTVKGINIISFGPHARRKWMVYNKILSENYKVGMISYPDFYNPGPLKDIFKELREFFGLVYYWIILRFY